MTCDFATSAIELGGERLRPLRAEAAAYFASMMDPDATRALREEDESPHNADPASSVRRALVRRMGVDGWLAVGVPTDDADDGDFLAQIVVLQEAERVGAPYPFITMLSIVPALRRFGTDDQRRELLPLLVSGELAMAVGYSEPEAGTDLGGLRTRAERVDDEFVISGAKVYTSEADIADYIWLAARTDADSTGPAGISIVLVPTTAPGYSCSPLPTLADYRTTSTFYDEVRVPTTALIGELHRGWDVVVSQLNRERIAMAVRISTAASLEGSVLAALSGSTADDDTSSRTGSQARRSLAEARVENLAAQALVARQLSGESQGPAEAAMVKLFTSESAIRSTRLLMDAMGPVAAVPGDGVGGLLERTYRRAYIDTFGGGTNEIQRELIATTRLGLPRVRR